MPPARRAAPGDRAGGGQDAGARDPGRSGTASTDRFDLLTGGNRAALPRHQTLRTAIEWSYGLLNDAERTLLAAAVRIRGPVHAGRRRGRCAAPATCRPRPCPRPAVVAGRQVAGDQVRRRAAPACYRLHETMREYARLKLARGGRGRGRRRTALRRLLPGSRCARFAAGGTVPACWTGSRGPTWRSTTSGPSSGGASSAGTPRAAIELATTLELLLDHPRDGRGRAVARRAARCPPGQAATGASVPGRTSPAASSPCCRTTRRPRSPRCGAR